MRTPLPALLTLLLAGCSGGDLGVKAFNSPPNVSFQSPSDGSAVNEATQLDFQAVVSDNEDAPEALSLTFSSDLSGILTQEETADQDGVVKYGTASLAVGNHVITLQVVDTDGDSAEDTVSVEILDVPDPPEIVLLDPDPGQDGMEGVETTFTVTVSDAQQAPETLEVVFNSDQDGDFCSPTPDAAGEATCDYALRSGEHQLTFTVTDEDGFTDSTTLVYEVTDLDDTDDDGDGFSESQRDCDDTDASVYPGAEEDYSDDVDQDCNGVAEQDLDGDGYISLATGGDDCDDDDAFTFPGAAEAEEDDGICARDADEDGYGDEDATGDVEPGTDCDDADADVYPGSAESWDGVDQDCDGRVDNGTFGYDDDGDGQTEEDGDCDDSDASVYSGATEIYDAKDNDCNGIVDDHTDYYDDDGDGYTEVAGDCDDTSAGDHPGASELEDGIDNDCDGTVDEGTAAYDDDGDGWSENDGDCDDSDATVAPDATEDTSDYVDQDCDGVAQLDLDGDGHISTSTGGDDCDDSDVWTFPGAAEDESDPTLCARDYDGDGFGDDSVSGSVDAGTDCDDGDKDINTDATEECDGYDNDCDGSVDEKNATGCSTYYYDYDGDGYGSDSVAGVCYCSATGYYTSPYDTDCYDLNDDASPAATKYKSYDRGDGSYDWDCDGKETKYYDSKGSCSASSIITCSSSDGWESKVQDCGDSDDYITDCTWVWLSTCDKTTTTKTQSCK
jgi:hypothetical protein